MEGNHRQGIPGKVEESSRQPVAGSQGRGRELLQVYFMCKGMLGVSDLQDHLTSRKGMNVNSHGCNPWNDFQFVPMAFGHANDFRDEYFAFLICNQTIIWYVLREQYLGY